MSKDFYTLLLYLHTESKAKDDPTDTTKKQKWINTKSKFSTWSGYRYSSNIYSRSLLIREIKKRLQEEDIQQTMKVWEFKLLLSCCTFVELRFLIYNIFFPDILERYGWTKIGRMKNFGFQNHFKSIVECLQLEQRISSNREDLLPDSILQLTKKGLEIVGRLNSVHYFYVGYHVQFMVGETINQISHTVRESALVVGRDFKNEIILVCFPFKSTSEFVSKILHKALTEIPPPEPYFDEEKEKKEEKKNKKGKQKVRTKQEQKKEENLFSYLCCFNHPLWKKIDSFSNVFEPPNSSSSSDKPLSSPSSLKPKKKKIIKPKKTIQMITPFYLPFIVQASDKALFNSFRKDPRHFPTFSKSNSAWYVSIPMLNFPWYMLEEHKGYRTPLHHSITSRLEQENYSYFIKIFSYHAMLQHWKEHALNIPRFIFRKSAYALYRKSSVKSEGKENRKGLSFFVHHECFDIKLINYISRFL